MSDDFASNEPKGQSVSIEEAEKMFLERVTECENEYENAVLDLVIFYSRTKRHEMAIQQLRRLLANTESPEKKASFYLKVGQLMEQLNNYEAAVNFYSQAFSLEPTNNGVWYFINNNLGFCLNHFERYSEAEPYCRAAIRVDPDLTNAFKNLGVSLEGQGQYAEAARTFIHAVQVNAADPRSLRHLERLAAAHPEVAVEMPDIAAQIETCRRAVLFAQGMRGIEG